MKQVFILFGVLLVMMLAAAYLQNGGVPKLFSSSPNSSSQPPGSLMRLGNTAIHVEVANTPETLEKGLSGRDNLAPNVGMLFVVQKKSRPVFWMKNMKFNLDMIWINSNKVVDVNRNVSTPQPDTPDNQLPKYSPNQPVDYVLEVTSGFAKQYNITPGTSVELPEELK